MTNPSSNLVDPSRLSSRPVTVRSGRNAWSSSGAPPTPRRDGDVRELEAYGRRQHTFANEDVDVIPEQQRVGCWYGFTRGLRAMWSTRQMKVGNGDHDWYIKTTIRELLVYIVFLTVLCVLTFGMMSPTMYFHTKVLSDLFLESKPTGEEVNVRSASQIGDFWTLANKVLLDALYTEQWYNTNETALDDRNVLYENRLLGPPRLRQLRVRNDSCNVHDDFKKAITSCYDVYSSHIEDRDPFGLMNGTAWTYHTEKELKGSNHWGILSSYSGAGAYMDLGITKSEAKRRLEELFANLWIERATRAVFWDFTVYNANINLFCVIKLVFEFPATGGVMTSWSFRTVKLLRYVSISDHFIMACEVVFTFFILYYIVEEILEIRQAKCSYFKSVWNILDIIVIVISVICIFFSVYRTIMVDSLLESLLSKPDEFADFESLGFWQTQFNNVVAMAVFFAWIKIFKYISFNKTMTQLSSTLSRCSKDVAGFAVMFFIVFFAFAQLGYLLFGTQVKEFSSFMAAVFTLLRLILGDFNFEALEAANRVLGPIYFLSYVFFVFFVLMNMFLAIINDTYAEVKSEISEQKSEFEFGDFFKRNYLSWMNKLGKRDQVRDLHSALKLADLDGDSRLSFEEVRRKLKAQNYTDMEIEMFFAKYDTDGDRELDENETKQMLADLEGQKIQLDEEIEQQQSNEQSGGSRPSSATKGSQDVTGVSLDDFNVLSRRVDRMEHSIGSIVSKIDAVLVKMESMEKAKTRRRENMNKILDTISEDDNLDEQAKRQQMEQMVRDELQRWDSDASLNAPHRERLGTP